jgi:hypothetical protein
LGSQFDFGAGATGLAVGLDVGLAVGLGVIFVCTLDATGKGVDVGIFGVGVTVGATVGVAVGDAAVCSPSTAGFAVGELFVEVSCACGDTIVPTTPKPIKATNTPPTQRAILPALIATSPLLVLA